MSETTVLLLALGIILLVGTCLGGTAFLIRRYHTRPLPPPQVTPGPDGPVVQIPTRQVSVIRSSMPSVALAQYAVRGTLWLRPEGIEYSRLVRPKRRDWAEIAFVDTPDPGHDTYLTINFTGGSGIGVLTATPEALRVALAELSRGARLSTPAWSRIARPNPPGSGLPPFPPGPGLHGGPQGRHGGPPGPPGPQAR